MFGALSALAALRAQGVPHGRAVIMIEFCEESGSPDLPHYVRSLRARIGIPTLIVCLDSGCGDYERMWVTTSLRGLIGGNLRTRILREGVHSGSSSGVVPSSFRLTRQLLSRIEDEASGRVLLPELHCPIPPARLAQAAATAALLGPSIITNFPFVDGARPHAPEDLGELLLRRTWRPALSITGADGLPPLDRAGNVLRTETALKLSMRLPPRCAAEPAAAALKAALEASPPCGAHVSFELEKSGAGWDAPESEPWLAEAVEAASVGAFGREAAFHGEGGSIPFMGMLGELFPKAQFVVTGVLGPASNAHGPDVRGKRQRGCARARTRGLPSSYLLPLTSPPPSLRSRRSFCILTIPSASFLQWRSFWRRTRCKRAARTRAWQGAPSTWRALTASAATKRGRAHELVMVRVRACACVRVCVWEGGGCVGRAHLRCAALGASPDAHSNKGNLRLRFLKAVRFASCEGL